MEEWKPILIDGEVSHYEISNHGRVRNSNNGQLRKVSNGQVNLCHNGQRKTRRVSKLMEDTFNIERERKPHKSKNVGKNNGSARAVICLNTLEVFDTIKDAGKWCGLKDEKTISKCCRGKRKSAGKHPILGTKLKWMFHDEYLLKNN